MTDCFSCTLISFLIAFCLSTFVHPVSVNRTISWNTLIVKIQTNQTNKNPMQLTLTSERSSSLQLQVAAESFSTMLSSLILCLIVMTFSRQTTASHFRGGIITWKPGGNNSNKVKEEITRVYWVIFQKHYTCQQKDIAYMYIDIYRQVVLYCSSMGRTVRISNGLKFE